MTDSELLTRAEIAEITGYKTAKFQKNWLTKNKWIYSSDAAGRPIVARLYFRMKMGLPPSANQPLPPNNAWSPDFSKIL